MNKQLIVIQYIIHYMMSKQLTISIATKVFFFFFQYNKMTVACYITVMFLFLYNKKTSHFFLL